MVEKNYNALSLFSGAGGLDLGFHQAGGVRTLACCEWNEDAYQTLAHNRAHLEIGSTDSRYPLLLNGDLAHASTLDAVAALDKRVDIVFGGPPCQSFSIMGKKGSIDDSRGALIYAFSEAVSRFRARAFLFENVPYFAKIDGGRVAEDFKRQFTAMGYSLWSGLLNAADFGALTFRTRFIMIGIRGIAPVSLPQPTHAKRPQLELFSATQLRPWRTCREVFVDIEEAEKGVPELLNHDKISHTSETIDRFRKLAFGETDNIRKRNRLDPDRPSHSIYVGGKVGKLQARTHIHPYLPRELTARECAVIQGFPIDWKFHGRRDSAVVQAANAVPIPLAKALATHIVAELGGTRSGEASTALPSVS
jgi:DNA (cytosine-5)-methyltransferase 1